MQATKATDAAAVEKAGAALGPTGVPVPAPKATDVAAAEKAGVAHGPAPIPVPAMKATDAATAEKAGVAHGPAPIPVQATKATDAAAVEKAGAAHGLTGVPAQATKATDLPPAEAKADQRQAPAAIEALAPEKKVVPALGETKAEQQGPRAAEAAPQQANGKNAGGAGTKAEPSHGSTEASGQAKDVAAAPAAKTDPGRDHAQAPGQAKATDIPVAADAKAGQALAGSAEAFANQAKAKDAPVVGTKPDLGHASAETPGDQSKPKDVPVAAEAKADPGHGQPEATKQAKANDVPDTITIHATNLWLGSEEQSGHSQKYVLPPEKTEPPPVVHVTGLMGADGEQSKAATLPAGNGSPSDGAVLFFPLGSSEKGAAGTPDRPAPESVSGKGSDPAPAHKAADADPVGTKTQEAAKGGQDQAAATKPSAPSGDAAGGVVPAAPAGQEKANGQALTEYDALALLSVTASDGGAAHHNGQTAGKSFGLEHLDLNTPAPDSAWHHPAPHDSVLL